MKDAINEIEEMLVNRGKGYDKGQERSMEATVTAFNAVTGLELTEAQGWQFMMMLKMVRENRQHKDDNILDLACYGALLLECNNR